MHPALLKTNPHYLAYQGIGQQLMKQNDQNTSFMPQLHNRGNSHCHVKSTCVLIILIHSLVFEDVIEILSIYSRYHNLCLTVVYRQADNNTSENKSKAVEFEIAMDKLLNNLIKLKGPMPNIIIFGDFNTPNVR